MARRAAIGDIVDQLVDGAAHGVLLVGSPGTGKTWMLGQILTALGSECCIIKLSASKALAAIPFGAVNARVGSSIVRSSDYYQVLNGLLEQINSAEAKQHRVYLAVDNAEHLDGQSAAIIQQAVMSTEARLIVVDHAGSGATPLRELWRDGHLTRFEVAPLGTREVRRMLESILGGRVAGPAADYLSARSGGNPLVLRGLLAGAQEEGSLQKVNNIWVLNHPNDRLGTESWEFLQLDLDHLSTDSRRILELLALGGSLPLDVLLELSGADAVDDVQQRELVRVENDQRMSFRLARAATAASIRKMIPVGRSRQYLTDVRKLMPDGYLETSIGLISFTRWSMDCGLPLPEEQVLQAAVSANRLMRPHEALQFSNVVMGRERAAAMLVERAIAHRNCNSLSEARTLSLQALELASTPEAAASALYAVHMSHVSEVDYEIRFAEALSRFESRFGVVRLGQATTRADIDVLLVLAQRDVSTGAVEAATSNLEYLLNHPLTRNPGDRVMLKSLYSEVLCATGSMAKAVDLALEVIGELEGPGDFPRPDISILAYTRSVATFIHDGAWELVQAALSPDTFVNPDLMLHSGGLRDLADASMMCRRGHTEEALSSLEAAVGALEDYDPWSVLPTAVGLLAYCHAMRGDYAEAQRILLTFSSLNLRSGKFHELEAAAYAAAAQYSVGQLDLGMTKLRSLQRECMNHGYFGVELCVLSLMVRLEDTAAIMRLAEVAAMVESHSKEFFVAWARALHSQDPASLDRASATALDFGFELVAVELATQALKKFHDRGKIQTSRKTARKVVAMREQMPGLVSPVFNVLDQPKMTRREHQIALLVAQGETNNAIAASLNVSLRTIEGHLYRTFIKLDIQSREQLAALMKGPVAEKSETGTTGSAIWTENDEYRVVTPQSRVSTTRESGR